MQTIYAHPQFLIETSIFMINAERVDTRVWHRRQCQTVLNHVNNVYNDVIQAMIVYYPRGLQHQIKERADAILAEKELLTRLLTESWSPFLLKWNLKFFNQKMRPRLYVPQQVRYDMQCDFMTIQGVVAELCGDLQNLDTPGGPSYPQPPSRKEGRSPVV